MSERDPMDDLFALARDNPPPMTNAFLGRVLADAEAEQTRVRTTASQKPASLGLWQMFLSALGGAGAVAGISSAAVAGVVIGYVQPDALLTLADSYGIATSASDSFDLLPGYDSLLSVELVE